jgi:membrane-bound lytic murein transglycosylase D
VRARERYDSLFQFYGEKHKLDWLALKAQGIVESSLVPTAVNAHSGATGLMQFMLPTWIEWHNRLYDSGGVEERTHPERSIELGAAYMAWLTEQLNRDPRLARAAYNWGIGNVKRAAVRVGYRLILPDDKLPLETRVYLARIDRIYNDLSGGTA